MDRSIHYYNPWDCGKDNYWGNRITHCTITHCVWHKEPRFTTLEEAQEVVAQMGSEAERIRLEQAEAQAMQALRLATQETIQAKREWLANNKQGDDWERYRQALRGYKSAVDRAYQAQRLLEYSVGCVERAELFIERLQLKQSKP